MMSLVWDPTSRSNVYLLRSNPSLLLGSPTPLQPPDSCDFCLRRAEGTPKEFLTPYLIVNFFYCLLYAPHWAPVSRLLFLYRAEAHNKFKTLLSDFIPLLLLRHLWNFRAVRHETTRNQVRIIINNHLNSLKIF